MSEANDSSTDLARVAMILEAFEASDWDEINVRSHGVELRLSATVGTAPSLLARDEQSHPDTTEPLDQPDLPDELTAAPDRQSQTLRSTGPTTDVVAPTLGIFWRASSPTASPFVVVGQEVAAEDQVGIVEVMKLMTRVTAPHAGRIVEILVRDGETVEESQVLLHISPSGSPTAEETL